MCMRRAVVALAGAAVMTIGPSVLSSSAATVMTWTVRPGGSITATAGKTTLIDLKTGKGSTVTCQSSRMSGALKPGGGLAGAGIGSITAAAYSCPNPFGYYKLIPRGLPWQVNLVSYDARTGLSRGTISHLKLAFAVFGTPCSAVINGTSNAAADGVVAMTYSDQTGKLKILAADGTLHWYYVHSCAHAVSNGDPAALSAAYTISPPQTITSP
jgi:hypothetical protein